MTAIFEHDFENNSLATWDANDGSVSPTIQTGVVYERTRALRCLTSTQSCRLLKGFTSDTTVAARFVVRRASANEETPILFTVWNTGSFDGLIIQYLSPNLVLRTQEAFSQVTIDTYGAMPIDEWLLIDLKADVSANPWSAGWRVNGVDQGSFAPALPAETFNQISLGTWGYDMSWDAYFDRFQLHDQFAYIEFGQRRPLHLYGPAQLGTTPATVFTAPATSKVLLRHVHVSNPSGSAVGLTLAIGADGAATRIFDDFEIPADSAPSWTMLEWLEPGEIIQAFADTAATLVLTLDGYERPMP